ncbi:MAG: hypothetical protein JW953_10905 [Anaerolineae bacterium]|nr:hypothetical protein [Anaerolineae bacterium]
MSLFSKLTATVGHLFTTTEPAIVEQKQRRQVQHILRREWRHCNDREYGQHLAALLAGTPLDGEIKEQDRPPALAVERALRQACQLWPQAQAVWADPLCLLDQQQQQPPSPEHLIAELQNADWRKRFIARHTLLALGGEAVPHLAALATNKKTLLGEDAVWLLRSIEADTMARFSAHYTYLLCPRCLVHYYANQVYRPDLPPIVYYGCRTCGQSREFLEWRGQVVTVLDKRMEAAYTEQEGIIWGNWFLSRSLFDCDWVEIIRATDEDVERFAIQIGNDTDPFRKPRYKEMRCVIGPECQLSENTLRILNRMFGQIEREQR